VGIATIVGNTTPEAERRLARLAKLFNISPDEQRKQLGKVYGAPDEVADFLQNYVSRGVQILTPRFFYMDSMEAFATEVIPKV
jgi:alkanesulfonate monooxygenase SsuD/methylene tetrahydromethanopterin reductase-like flavin-dependent oxidoreductase (luciferase family)